MSGVIVLGCPRSGTTLLQRLLDAHPNIACPPEPVVFSRVGRLLEEDPLAEGMSFGLRSGLAFSGVSEDEVLDRVRAMAFGFMESLARRAGKPRWASKTAMDAFHVDAIEALCGDRVRYVVVVRNGFDAVCSMRDLCESNGSLLPELHAYSQRWPFLDEALAHAWADVNGRLGRLLADRPATALRVRYEDLVEAPEAQLHRMFGFLGESMGDGLVEQALAANPRLGFGDHTTGPIQTSRVGRSRRELSPHTRSRLAPILNPQLEANGYPLAAVLPPRTPEQARQAFALGVAAAGLKRP